MWSHYCRVKKKTNLDHTEVAAAVETAVNVEKVRKRIKKRTKQRETTADAVDRDAVDGHEGTQGESQDNLGYESAERQVHWRFIILRYNRALKHTTAKRLSISILYTARSAQVSASLLQACYLIGGQKSEVFNLK